VVVTADAQGRPTNGTVVTVVVRELHAPTKAIAHAQASLTAGDSSQAWEADPELLTDSVAVVSLGFRSSGPYEVRLRRVGYPALRVRVWLPADCRNTLEVYMVWLRCDIGPCPSPPPARATLTTCRARAA
jgi:hypothetical protein